MQKKSTFSTIFNAVLEITTTTIGKLQRKEGKNGVKQGGRE
jgi:hypothetical protein